MEKRFPLGHISYFPYCSTVIAETTMSSRECNVGDDYDNTAAKFVCQSTILVHII